MKFDESKIREAMELGKIVKNQLNGYEANPERDVTLKENISPILLELTDAVLNKELVEPMSESEIIKEISSIRSRIVEIRDSLIGDDNRKGYGLDEWSPPCENLSYLIKKIDGLAQSIVGKVGK